MPPEPERIGVCPNRIGDSRYIASALILQDGEPAICEHCASPLIVYTRDFDAREGSPPAGG